MSSLLFFIFDVLTQLFQEFASIKFFVEPYYQHFNRILIQVIETEMTEVEGVELVAFVIDKFLLKRRAILIHERQMIFIVF